MGMQPKFTVEGEGGICRAVWPVIPGARRNPVRCESKIAAVRTPSFRAIEMEGTGTL